MGNTISILSDIVTILSFPATIFFVVRELRKNNRALQTIIQQNTMINSPFVNKGKIEAVNFYTGNK